MAWLHPKEPSNKGLNKKKSPLHFLANPALISLTLHVKQECEVKQEVFTS